ncbi:mono/diheme cytochrome c family protein [Salirhabdus euzebyi]|uniref:Mono/diheme cytochrome c family protein n=1 Tax=Salirhabdus euzebyi TaxID=394506 RepID=A0A841Q7A6_9BACI|nr:cytochrome c [Salirhabdus euzebyi]MBB6454301.1 mono/diheme cytochrome c family protein [Salirhabdus euzebyi]
MKKNPVIPYALIGALGILAMIVLASIGVNQMDEVRGGHGEEEPAGEQAGGGETDPEKIYQNSCLSCHGGDLEGSGIAPALNTVGGTLSKEEIENIINNGVPGTAMQGGFVDTEQASILAEWLAEKK